MHISVHPDPAAGNAAAAGLLAGWLSAPDTRRVMVAAGNTPIPLYDLVARRGLDLAHLQVFMLDEYVGVPATEPRSCAGLLRRTVADAWGVPAAQFHTIEPDPARALGSVLAHERKIDEAGGLDVVVLGLGQNGHLGFNEPGSTADSGARVLELEPISVEANRRWFGGEYAPDRGVTVGLRTILAARRVLILAYGPHKTNAVRAMVQGAITSACPASFLQSHPDVHVFLDIPAAHPNPTSGRAGSSPRCSS